MRAFPVIAVFCLAALIACSTTDTQSETAAPAVDPTIGVPDGGTVPAPSDGATEDASTDGNTTPEEEPAVPYVAFDINHVISTGQSNSVAHGGIPVLTTTQPFGNLMFNTGVMTVGTCEQEGCRAYQTPTGFSPLVEGDSYWYPVETMSSGLGDEVTRIATAKYGQPGHVVLVSLAGRNGLTYWCLRKGSCNYVDPTYVKPFEESMTQVADAKALAAAQGKSYVVRAVTAIHGESDDFGYATGHQEFPLDGTDGTFQALKSYADALLEWQHDYEMGVQAVTGQSQPVPLLISQFSGWNDIATSAVTQFQYEAHARSKGKVMLVTAGYMLDWGPDCRHYTNDGERRLGEYFGKVYSRVVFEGRRWEPVRPRHVTIAGAVITAQFFVPVPPLVLDPTRVTDPGDYGFEVVDATSTRLAITNVAVTSPDTVTITLAAPPAGAARLRYAFTGVPHSCPGRFVGPRGNLRDSDTTPSQYGYELFNWGVHFETPIE